MRRPARTVKAEASAGASLYLTAEEAAKVLGVAVASLYAYVSRKGIRSQAIPGTRARLYWREDIDRIAQGPGAERAIKWDSILVPETRITLLTEQGHYYRGQSAIALSETASLEDIAALLWGQDRSALFPPVALQAPEGFAEARTALARLAPTDQAVGLFPILEAAQPKNYDRSAAGFARTGAEVVRWLAAITVGEAQTSPDPIHLLLARAFSGLEAYADVIRRLLVLFADHELTAATYAVRAVANTGTTPYQAVTAGLVAHKGQRLVEGRAPAIKRFIEEVLSDPDPGHPVLERYRAGDDIPGFSHKLFKVADMRARALLPVLTDHFGEEADFKRLFQAIRVAQEGLGVEPNLALLALFIERKFRQRTGVGSIQLIARAVGWIAHAQEQMESGPLVRPRTAYTGVLPSDG